MRPHFLLGAVAVLALLLRFTGLSWGLRHTPHMDERYFVENTGWMLAHRDFDHRFYEYPGFFFYILAPVLAFFHPPDFGPAAYLAARAVVASFGVASVVLVYLLGSRLMGTSAGLFAAALLAVSPVEVQTAHTVRPDVVLETFVLLALLAFERTGAGLAPDVLSGAAVGAATAVKFSGVLLVPSYAIRRVAAPGLAWPPLALAGASALAAFVLLSPYSFLHLTEALAGVQTQVAYHYAERARGPTSYLGMVWTYGDVVLKALGWLAAALSGIGVFLGLKERRRFLHLLAFPLLAVAVFSTAEIHHDRFLVPALGVLTLFAGRAIEPLARRIPAAAVAVSLLAVAVPLTASIDYVRGISRPGTRDLALDWIESHLPPGSRVFTTVGDLGLDRSRYEVLTADGLEASSQIQAWHADLVVTGPDDDGVGEGSLKPVHTVEPSSPHGGPRLSLSKVREELRPRYERVRLQREWLTASEDPAGLSALIDGDLETSWATEAQEATGTWIEVAFPEPVPVGRLELRLGRRIRRFGRNLHVFVKEDGTEWRRVRVWQGRPPLEEQIPGEEGKSQVLLLEPVPVRGLRIVQVGQQGKPWGIAELYVDARQPAEVGPAGLPPTGTEPASPAPRD